MTKEDYIKKILEIHDVKYNLRRKAIYLGDGYFIDDDGYLMHICKPKLMWENFKKHSRYRWKDLGLIDLYRKLTSHDICGKCNKSLPKSILLKSQLDKL